MEFVLISRFWCLILLLVNYSSFIVSSASSVTAVNSSIELGGITWNTSHDGRVRWRTDCEFHFNITGVIVRSMSKITTIEECANECLNRTTTCNHFSLRKSDRHCNLIWFMKEQKPSKPWDESRTCGFIPTQMWSKSSDEDERILVKSNCVFPSLRDCDRINVEKSFNSCKRACFADHRCNAFSYNKNDQKCVLPFIIKTDQLSDSFLAGPQGPQLSRRSLFFDLVDPTFAPSANAECAIISVRDWFPGFLAVRRQEGCDFNDSYSIEDKGTKKRNSLDDCESLCFNNPRCTHFSYHNVDQKCYLKKASLETVPVPKNGSWCGYFPLKFQSEEISNWNITTINNKTVISFRKGCDFPLKSLSSTPNISADDCMRKCEGREDCNYFSHEGGENNNQCHLMFGFGLVQRREDKSKTGWTCGYVPKRIWKKSKIPVTDQRILASPPNCEFLSSDDNGTATNNPDVINKISFTLCQSDCLADHRCNAFSYVFSHPVRKCVLPHKAKQFETNFKLSTLGELLRRRRFIEGDSVPAACFIMPLRIWKTDLIGDGVLFQNDCNFDNGFNIQEPMKQKSFNDCVSHCFNVSRCTHFSYSKSNEMCSLKKAPALTERMATEDGEICGFIPSRRNITDGLPDWVSALISLAAVAIVILVIVSVVAFYKFKVIEEKYCGTNN